MKTFWAILGVLVVLGLVAVFLPQGGGEARAVLQQPVRTATPSPQEREPSDEIVAVPSFASSTLPTADAIADASTEATFEPIRVVGDDAADDAPIDAIGVALSGSDEAGDAEPEESAAGSASDADAAPSDDAPAPTDADTLADPAPTDGAETGVPSWDQIFGDDLGDVAESEADDATAIDAAAPDAPSPVEEQADGTLLIDGRFAVLGKGTAEEPYLLPWDVLVSAQRVYNPREGLDELPGWASHFDGKPIEITGYVAFPFMAGSADECLLMLNQWDGCCIGLPPTPYDAVEVHLREQVDTRGGMLNHGTLRGTLKIDPYVINGWLVGLYVLEDAGFAESGRAGQMPAHEAR